MELSDKTKILVLVAIISVVIFFFLQNRTDEEDEGTHNQGSLTQNLEKVEDKNISERDSQNESQDKEEEVERVEGEEDSMAEIERQIEAEEKQSLRQVIDRENAKEAKRRVTIRELPEGNVNVLKKFRTRNSSRDGKFVSSSFADGKRGGGRAADLDKFFEEGHPLEERIGFQRNDVIGQDIPYANYVPGKQRKLRDVDKFNAEAMLPKEKHKDWFDDPYESTSVKNTHLINIYRPIGINTISTTLKNANRQLRADPVNPKIGAISPWMNSSIEPDTNIRSQSLCV
jgi:hypothetical protein